MAHIYIKHRKYVIGILVILMYLRCFLFLARNLLSIKYNTLEACLW